MRHRFGQAHDPAHFVYHYLGCTPVQVISHDSAADTFVVEVASHRWDIKFKVNPATFETPIAAAAINSNQKNDRSAARMAEMHGAAVLRACSEFCEVNLLHSMRGRSALL